MPELPEVTLYVERLEALVGGQPLEKARVASPFLVRSVDPPIEAAEAKRLLGVRRIGKRIVWQFEDELFLVFHLMIAGRFHRRKPGASVAQKVALTAFDFPEATVLLTEAGSKKHGTQSTLVFRWTDRDP